MRECPIYDIAISDKGSSWVGQTKQVVQLTATTYQLYIYTIHVSPIPVVLVLVGCQTISFFIRQSSTLQTIHQNNSEKRDEENTAEHTYVISLLLSTYNFLSRFPPTMKSAKKKNFFGIIYQCCCWFEICDVCGLCLVVVAYVRRRVFVISKDQWWSEWMKCMLVCLISDRLTCPFSSVHCFSILQFPIFTATLLRDKIL